MSRTIGGRFRQGLLVGVGLAAVVYGGYFVWVGWADVSGALARFEWPLMALLLGLSLTNYALRFGRWELFLRTLDVRVPTGTSLAVFLAGLAMTITPGKVGEFLKSYLLQESHGVSMARTAPVVVAERVGDLLGLLLLASFGVAAYGGPGARPVLVVGAGAIIAALVVLQNRGLSAGVLGLVRKLPLGERVAPPIEAALEASRALFSARPLLGGLLLGTLAWYCECLGYYYTFAGFDGPRVAHGVAVFGYSFSTVAGVISPGGIGPTDIGLIEIAQRFTPGLQDDVATAASFLVRLATLWFAVLLGAIALVRFRSVLSVDVDAARAGTD
jgi:uncharacterized membrane protein YbhN (UPF0104 family)